MNTKSFKMNKKILNHITITFPILLTIAYLFLVAEARYISSSTFTLKSEGESGLGIDIGMLGGSSSSKQDQMIIKNYILSQDMMNKVIDKFGTEITLSDSKHDPLWKISEKSTTVAKFRRYNRIVSVIYDEEAGLTNLSIENFNPEHASSINKYILDESINFVNQFSSLMSDNFINFAENDVMKSKYRLSESLDKLNQFQKDENLITPETETELIMTRLTSLESSLSEEELKYQDLTGYLQNDTPQVQASLRRINNLKGQIREVQNQISSQSETSLNDQYRKYTELKGEVDFAQEAYLTSIKTLEAARIKAMQSQKHIMIIAHPSQPNESELPKRYFDLISYVMLILIINMTLRLVVRLFKEYE